MFRFPQRQRVTKVLLSNLYTVLQMFSLLLCSKQLSVQMVIAWKKTGEKLLLKTSSALLWVLNSLSENWTLSAFWQENWMKGWQKKGSNLGWSITLSKSRSTIQPISFYISYLPAMLVWERERERKKESLFMPLHYGNFSTIVCLDSEIDFFLCLVLWPIYLIPEIKTSCIWLPIDSIWAEMA